MSHPLTGFRAQGVNIKCFDENGGGLVKFHPISIVIGKNNCGKSTILDIVDTCINLNTGQSIKSVLVRSTGPAAIDIETTLNYETLKRQFPNSRSGGIIPGNHWRFGEKLFKPLVWRYTGNDQPKLMRPPEFDLLEPIREMEVEQRLLNCNNWSISDCTMLRVAAERSVVPEASDRPDPKPDGAGITNLIRYFIHNDSQPRDVVEKDLLQDLNSIYMGDSSFNSIICQENDAQGTWEIFLREQAKDDVRLSESGSSLQSIFIILAYFRLVPLLNKIDWNKLVLAIEEPENNLHPALLRRLLHFLASKRGELGFSLILTSHSPICIDWASRREDAGIIHVAREGNVSRCKNVLGYDEKIEILNDLDIRGSDILQSNGVIWVEGPSDRVYIRKWIELASSGELVEGNHYTFMYYGGKILAHFEAVPESEQSALISMVTLNRQVAIVIDSDRRPTASSGRKPRMNLNHTKKRLRKEVSERGGFCWVTAGKEIENYTPDSVWSRIVGRSIRTASEYEDIPNMPRVKSHQSSKVLLAHDVVDHLELSDLSGHLDLELCLQKLVKQIKSWNNIQD